MKELSLGFSPCPNDCFIFDAMVHGKIDTCGLKFNIVIEDVEALNKKAFHSELDITKLSFHAFAYLIDRYTLLDSGSALGFNCGPLLITKTSGLKLDENTRIAIPGKYTTANFLLSLAFPDAQLKFEMLFSEIEQAVLEGKADAGLIIHENRFTYQQKGLYKIIDLGEFWEGLIHAPIPLGGIVIQKSIPTDLQLKVNNIIRASIEFAYANPDSSMDFIKANAQEMSEDVMIKHIELYVNEYSIDLGKIGRNAVSTLFKKAEELKLIEHTNHSIFLQREGTI